MSPLASGPIIPNFGQTSTCITHNHLFCKSWVADNWRGTLEPALVRRYMALTSEAVFYLDPHICTRCRYRSTELLWQCPQCHEWNTFVEERLSPAKDSPTAELEPTER